MSGEIPVEKCLLYTHDGEAGNPYGRPRMENVRETYGWWRDCNDGAGRYDRKVAGVLVEVHYPNTDKLYRDREGNQRPAWMIAQRLLQEITSTGSVAIPNDYAPELDALEKQYGGKDLGTRWKIVRQDTGGAMQGGFVERARYLDSLKFRGWLVPERAATEGQFGTKAEAETHANLALIGCELVHQDIVRTLNWFAVNQALALNFGPRARGSVWLKPAPLQDDARVFFRSLLVALISARGGVETALRLLDWEGMIDQSGVPKAKDFVNALRAALEALPANAETSADVAAAARALPDVAAKQAEAA